jgi:hypothetical protein
MHPVDYRKHIPRNNFSKFVICISFCTLNRHALILTFYGKIPVSFAICIGPLIFISGSLAVYLCDLGWEK